MTSLKNQKRLAAKAVSVGIDNVRLVPERISEIKEAITKEDIRALIKSGAIIIYAKKSPSRIRARLRQKQKKRGRRRGAGKRKGAKFARAPGKLTWTRKIRLMRSTLKALREKNRITKETYKDIYLKAKGGFFRDKGHMMFYLEQGKLLK
jgi:large subunit ribosomal protein L19e